MHHRPRRLCDLPRGLLATSLLTATLSAAPGLATAQSAADAKDSEDRRGTWTFILENDVFANTDRDYTSGLRTSYVSPPDSPGDGQGSGLHGAIARTLLGARDGDRIRYGLAIGQSIFTPKDTMVENPPSDQHPYAGWLYGEYSVFAQDRDDGSGSGGGLTIGALQIGIVGPHAYGEEVQNNFHELIRSYEVRGWENQLNDEVAFAVLLERQERLQLYDDLLGLKLDLIPNYGVTLGTLRTDAKVGATLRYGSDLRSDFGPPRIRPAVGGSGFFEATGEFSWYLFAGAEGRAVARNIFLDGNTFEDSASVDKKVLVAEAQAGLVTTFDAVRVAYTAVVRSPQFDGQDEPQIFGSISLSVKF